MTRAALRLPDHVARAIWRGQDLGQANTVVRPSGHPVLDAELPDGGWPCQSVIDILQPQAAQAEWRLLGPSLKALIMQGGSVLLIGPPQEPGLLGLQQAGLPGERLLRIGAQTVAERLWATEQALKTPCLSAVLCWLPQALPAQVRRLQACAAQHPGLLFLFRPLAAQGDPSAAPLRLRLSLGEWPHPLQVDILKRRGPALERPLTLLHWPSGLMPLMQVSRATVQAPRPTPPRRTHTGAPALLPPLNAHITTPSSAHHADLDRPDSRPGDAFAGGTGQPARATH